MESHSAGDYLPNFASLARKGYNIIIGAGFLLAAQENTVAKQFPNTKFAITDYDVTGPPFNGKAKNVEGLTYATQENSYLVGCLAGLMVKKKGGDQVIGVVGGVKIPPVDSFLAGYQAGAKKCNPGIKVLKGYSQDFIDQAKCKTVAQNQIDAGSQVEFNVAGPCGLGTLDAAKEAGIWGIGVDVDQAYLGKHILTSAVKRVDTRRVPRHQGRAERPVQGRQEPRLQPQERRRRPRQDQPERPRQVPEDDRRPAEADRRGQDQAAGEGRLAPHVARERAGHRARPLRSSVESRLVAESTPPVLELRGITKRFPGVLANDARRLRPPPGRGARAARRERRRQVDADEHPLRALQARRGRDPARTASRSRIDSPQAAIDAGHRHGAPALHAHPGDDRRREHRARDRADEARASLLDYDAAAERRVRELAEQFKFAHRPATRASRTSRSASSSASRS